jgi:hypothetical protein
MMSARAGALASENLTPLGQTEALYERDRAPKSGNAAPTNGVPLAWIEASRRLPTMVRLQKVVYLLSRAGA